MAAAALMVAAMAGAPGTARAQTVVVIVNGDPVTTYDIDQRTRLMQISTQRSPSRQEVLNELIDEKLKIQLLRRYTIDAIDNDVENAFNNMARRSNMSPAQFGEQLAKANVSTGTLKSRMKAEIVWSQVIRGRFMANSQVSEKDILAKLETRKPEDQGQFGFDYTLRPILFVVPRRSSGATFEARRKDAETLRTRFLNCQDGIALARSLRDVAVRATVVRSSADLPPQLRELLEKTEIGRLTAPEATSQGVEVYALCDKKPSRADNTPGKREAREELMTAQFQNHSKRYIKELRSQAMIEHK